MIVSRALSARIVLKADARAARRWAGGYSAIASLGVGVKRRKDARFALQQNKSFWG
jgi:hypothetical protein